uniref:Sodium/calcium exchanger membrane region domain-containing protein n=1 Tax=Strigamia maritima TaxID=126957 RepID=T1IT24_STRMM
MHVHINRTMEDMNITNCSPPAVDDFPSDGLDRSERLQGWIAVHIFVAVYTIGALAIVCDDYFAPVMHLFSERLKLPNDISGATFMALGTTCPELFVASIGAFITEGDIGIGAVLGSAVFNVLVIVSVCGIFAGTVVALNWRPLARDCISYLIAVATLWYIIEDEQINVWEACVLIIEYCIYIFVLCLNIKFQKYCRGPRQSYDVSDGVVTVIFQSVVVGSYVANPNIAIIPRMKIGNEDMSNEITTTDITFDRNHNNQIYEEKEKAEKIKNERKNYCSTEFKFPADGIFNRVIWIIWWPVKFLFYLTIPHISDEQSCCLSIVTFVMSTMYIACTSYIATWMVSVLGYTINVPDSVMGLTFMALGNCLPEFISSIIVARQGLGNMALSNAMGGNLFALLICLGVPWAVMASVSQIGYVKIHSEGLTYSVITLFGTVIFMFGVVAINRFRSS